MFTNILLKKISLGNKPGNLCKEHSLESIELSGHLFGEVPEVGGLNHLQAFL